MFVSALVAYAVCGKARRCNTLKIFLGKWRAWAPRYQGQSNSERSQTLLATTRVVCCTFQFRTQQEDVTTIWRRVFVGNTPPEIF